MSDGNGVPVAPDPLRVRGDLLLDDRQVGAVEKTANIPQESVLGKAHRAVHQERGPAYGHPLDNHTTTARLFTAYLSRKHGVEVALDAEDVCFMNALQKISREAHKPSEDGLVDIAGYAHNIELVRDERDRRSRVDTP